MYSILNYNEDNKKTAKGVIAEVKENQITHGDFRTSLFDKQVLNHRGSKIIQEKHHYFSADVRKVTLSPFNDKKWITKSCEDFISLSHGHKEIIRFQCLGREVWGMFGRCLRDALGWRWCGLGAFGGFMHI